MTDSEPIPPPEHPTVMIRATPQGLQISAPDDLDLTVFLLSQALAQITVHKRKKAEDLIRLIPRIPGLERNGSH